MTALLIYELNLTTLRASYIPLFHIWGCMCKIYSQWRNDTRGKHGASYARISVENAQWVTQGYVWKTYTELREDTLRKYTASYATIRVENIGRVTQGYVWKTYNELRKDTSEKHTLSYMRTRLENIQRATQGYVKTYNELRKDALRKYTASYAKIRVENIVSYAWIRLASIQRVTHEYVWKIYSELRKDTCEKQTASYITSHQLHVTYCWVLQPSMCRLFEHSQGPRTHVSTYWILRQYHSYNYTVLC